MFTCFHCGQQSVVWQNNFSYKKCGYDGEGIVQFFHCSHCGAEIEYCIPLDEPDGSGVSVEQPDSYE